MKSQFSSLVAVLSLCFALTPAAHAGIRVAVTVDDMPGGPAELASIGKVLAKHHIPPTYGFVNGSQTANHPEQLQALKDWVTAGNRVANHTWSHLSLNASGVDAFVADLQRNEPLLSSVAGDDSSWRILRYPFLDEGIDVASHKTVRQHLAKNNYAVAEVSVDFFDWAFSGTYARCAAKQDTAGMNAIRERYLSEAKTFLKFADKASHDFFGRSIDQILLIHANSLNADLTDELFTAYEAMGVQFIALEDAMKDPAYATDLSGTWGGSFFGQMMRTFPRSIRTQMPPHFTQGFDDLCK